MKDRTILKEQLEENHEIRKHRLQDLRDPTKQQALREESDQSVSLSQSKSISEFELNFELSIANSKMI